MKHTPEVLEVKPVAIEFTDDGKLIGTLNIEIKADSISFPEMKNIAQLYKAAPELLEALKEATDWLTESPEGKAVPQINGQPGMWLAKALAAIAKAEGK